MIKGIDVVFIHVKDPEKMAKWYEEKLGLKIGFSIPTKEWQEFSLAENRPTTRFALDYSGPEPSDIEKQPIIISFKVENILDAVKHFGVYGLQKVTEKQSKRTTVCYSYFQPNGGAEMSSSDKERVYYIVSGSITVNGKGESHVLNAGDIIYIGPGEERDMVINEGKPAEVLVFIVTP